ncbi:MAG: methyltransferase [Planctomycetota bacterium]
MAIDTSLKFLKEYLRNPRSVGSMVPSSQALAAAVCDPYRRCKKPAAVLEVGAGTGPITKYLGTILKPEDHLDVCELNEDFADTLEEEVLSNGDFRSAVAAGRVNLLRKPIQEIDAVERYDFVISGLPFTSFGIRDVRAILNVIRRCLKPGGTFSYYEYVGLRRASRTLSLGKKRKRVAQVSEYLSRSIAKHQFKEKTILRNFPPAYARHLRFDMEKVS